MQQTLANVPVRNDLTINSIYPGIDQGKHSMLTNVAYKGLFIRYCTDHTVSRRPFIELLIKGKAGVNELLRIYTAEGLRQLISKYPPASNCVLEVTLKAKAGKGNSFHAFCLRQFQKNPDNSYSLFSVSTVDTEGKINGWATVWGEQHRHLMSQAIKEPEIDKEVPVSVKRRKRGNHFDSTVSIPKGSDIFISAPVPHKQTGSIRVRVVVKDKEVTPGFSTERDAKVFIRTIEKIFNPPQ